MHEFHCDKDLLHSNSRKRELLNNENHCDYRAKTVLANVKYPTGSLKNSIQPYALILDPIAAEKDVCCKYYDLNAFRPDIRCESLLLKEARGSSIGVEVIVLYESKSCTDRESMIPKHIIYKHEIFSSVR